MASLLREWILGMGAAQAGERLVHSGQRITVQESARDCSDASADTREFLQSLEWAPQQFDAVCHASNKAQAVVEFPSAMAHVEGCSATATMTWHSARDAAGHAAAGPAVIVLDILNASNIISGYIGRSLSRAGIHAFVLDLPHSTKRSAGGRDCKTLFNSTRQAIADARRARDIAAAMPNVDGRIGIQGTSFGGFVATITAGLDSAFDLNLLCLCGGNVNRIISDGQVESAKLRRRLADAGIGTPEAVRHFLWQLEPLRVAHRLNARRTWMWVARRDQVVALQHSQELADAIGVTPDRMQTLSGCHYTCALATPWWARRVVQTAAKAWGLAPQTDIAHDIDSELAVA